MAYEMRISDWSSDVCSSDLPSYVRFEVVAYTETGKKATLCGLPDGTWLPGNGVLTGDAAQAVMDLACSVRSEERRVGKACVSTCRSRWSRNHYKQNPLTIYFSYKHEMSNKQDTIHAH